MSDPAHQHADDGHVHVHVHPTKFYLGVLGALLSLTVLTVLTAVYVDLDEITALGGEVRGIGAWNLGLAMIIATTKASLVCLFFMHLREDKRFNALVFVGSLLFVGVFFAYTLNDTDTRGQMGDAFNGVEIDPERGTRAPGGIDYTIQGEAWLPGFDHGLLKEAAEKEAPASDEEAAAVPDEASAEALPLAEDLLGDEVGDVDLAAEGDEAEALMDEIEAEGEAPTVAPERAAPRALPSRPAAQRPRPLAEPEEEAAPAD